MDPSSVNRSLPKLSDEDWTRAMGPYEQALAQMSNEQLLSELTRINAALQSTTTQSTMDFLRAKLEAESRPLDSSARTARPSPERPDPRRRSSPSRPPSALELLASSNRMGPRLAAKLTLASARAVAKDKG